MQASERTRKPKPKESAVIFFSSPFIFFAPFPRLLLSFSVSLHFYRIRSKHVMNVVKEWKEERIDRTGWEIRLRNKYNDSGTHTNCTAYTTIYKVY